MALISDRISVLTQVDRHLLPKVAGFQQMILKSNDKGFTGAAFVAPLITAADVLAAIETGGENSPLVALCVSALEQGQRDLVRSKILNAEIEPGAGSVAVADLQIESVLGFMSASGAAGFRFTREVFDLVSPIIRLAILAFYLEKRPADAQLPESEQIAKALPTINRYLNLVWQLHQCRNAKEESQKAFFDPAQAKNLVEVLNIAIDANPDCSELRGVLAMAVDAEKRANADVI